MLDEQFPALEKLIKEEGVPVEMVDVFCEKGIFENHHSRQILQVHSRL